MLKYGAFIQTERQSAGKIPIQEAEKSEVRRSIKLLKLWQNNGDKNMTYDTSAIKSVISCRELCENNGIAVNSKGKARCVFHDDAHASMHVYDDGVHCFSCGAHTDVIGLAQELYGVNFPEACRILAEQYGIAPESSSDWKRKADAEAL